MYGIIILIVIVVEKERIGGQIRIEIVEFV